MVEFRSPASTAVWVSMLHTSTPPPTSPYLHATDKKTHDHNIQHSLLKKAERLKDRANSPPINASPLRLLLPSIPRLLRRKVLQLLLINTRLSTVKIRSLRTHTLALHDKLVPEDHDKVQRDTQVRSNEVLIIPRAIRVLASVLGQKVVEPLENGDQAAEHETDVRPPDSAGRDKGQGAVGDILSAARAHEVDVRHQDGDPCQESEDGDEVDEVLEDCHGGGVDAQEGEEAEERGETEGVDGDTAAVGAGEDLGGVALDCETVEGTGCDVEI